MADSRIKERVAREEDAHIHDGVLENSYRLKNRFHHIWTYPSHRRIKRLKSALLQNIEGLDVLDYGCGWGVSSMDYYQQGANVTGIDISEKFIGAANDDFESRRYDRERYRFLKMDAHHLQFGDGAFDIVVGDGILHHLDTETALSEIYRVLKPGGRAILFEPLAGNPLLKVFRLLTPHARTADEAPLTASKLRTFRRMRPWAVEHVYCGIIEAPLAVITSVLMPNSPENWLLNAADKIEQWLIDKGILLSWNQYVLLNFKKNESEDA